MGKFVDTATFYMGIGTCIGLVVGIVVAVKEGASALSFYISKNRIFYTSYNERR